MVLIDEVYNRLLSIGYVETLFGSLDRFKHSGNGFIACCPFHNDKNPSFSIASDKPFWNCFAGCGSGDWIGYLMRKNGITFKEALTFLAKEAGLDALSVDTNDWQNRVSKALVFEEIQKIISENLFSTYGQLALTYLHSRGYSDTEIRSSGFGAIPPLTILSEALQRQGFDISVVRDAFKTAGLGTEYTVSLPYRDTTGNIKGFIVRTTDKDVSPKYKFTAGTEKDTLFNIHNCRSAKYLVIVEGFIDSAIATSKGMFNVVALGQASLSDHHIRDISRLKHWQVILALDNDEAGRQGTERSIKLLQEHGITSYVALLPTDCKDPDDVLRIHGIEAFRHYIEHAMAGHSWLAHRIIIKYNLDTDRERYAAKRELLQYSLTVKDSLQSKELRDYLQSVFRLDVQELESEYAELHRLGIQHDTEERLKSALRKGQEYANNHQFDKLIEHITEVSKYAQAATLQSSPKQYTYNDFIGEIQRTDEGVPTGFPSLDNYITLRPGAITIIAGRPRHGKTTMLINLLANQLQQFPQSRFLYFSYEESRKDIAVKILTLLSGETINTYQNIRNIENYLRGDNNSRNLLEQGRNILREYLDSSRLQIIDIPYYVDELCTTIRHILDEKHLPPVSAIYIDYIQKIKIKGKFQSRQIEIQKTSEQILELAKEISLPIVMGAQFNRDSMNKIRPRLENLRESGDIENDANTILGLYNESVEKAEDGEKIKDPVDLEVSILKNRNGVSNETVTLTFHRPTMKITDTCNNSYSTLFEQPQTSRK